MMSSDVYICDFCEFELGWEEHDEIHGDIWGCEACGKVFCSKCLKAKIGEENYLPVMQGNSKVYQDDMLRCPDCIGKKSAEDAPNSKRPRFVGIPSLKRT